MKIKKCRFCNSQKLSVFLDLGKTPPADQFLKTPQKDSQNIVETVAIRTGANTIKVFRIIF